jgi:hypothetical protein
MHDQAVRIQSEIRQDIEVYSARIQFLTVQESSFTVRKAEACKELCSSREEVLTWSTAAANAQRDVKIARDRLTTIECEFKVDAELIRASVEVLRKKNVSLERAIESVDSRLKIDQERISDLRTSSSTAQRNCSDLREALNQLLIDRDSFMNEKSALVQELDKLQSDSLNNQAVLNAKRCEVTEVFSRKSKYDSWSREVRDKEFSILEGLKQVQVDQARNVSDITRNKKVHESLSRTIGSMRTRLQGLTDEIMCKQEELSHLINHNKLSGGHVDSFESDLKESELKLIKLKRGLADVHAQLATASVRECELKSRLAQTRMEFDASASDSKQAEANFESRNREGIRNRARFDVQTGELAHLHAELEGASSELNRTRRRRPHGPVPTILIESGSSLLDKFQINAFLRHSQQQAYPIPSFVDKLAELVNVLQKSREKADEALLNLQGRNSEITANRHVSTNIEETRYRLSSFKSDSLFRCVGNQIMSQERNIDIVLDHCSISVTELDLIFDLLSKHESMHAITSLSVKQNLLDDSSTESFLRMLHSLPYICRLDLAGNEFSDRAVRFFTAALRGSEGITECYATIDEHGLPRSNALGAATSAVVIAKSGKMVRITIDLRQQGPSSCIAPANLKPIQNTYAPVEPRHRPDTESGIQEVEKPTMKREKQSSAVAKPKQTPRPSSPIKLPLRKSSAPVGSARSSSVSDESFVRQLSLVKRSVAAKASRLGIKITAKTS